MRRKMPIPLLVGMLLVVMLAGGVGAQENGVSEARFARLARGINLAFWFWYGPDDLEEAAGYFTAKDFDLIRELGFTFVRVPIDLDFLLDEKSPDLLNSDALAVLDGAIEAIVDADLAVMVDLHSTSLADAEAAIYSGRLEDDPDFAGLFINFWRSLAAHLSATDPERVFLEPMNEPVFEDDPERWIPIQDALLAAIREGAPEHTLVATGALWSSRETLLALEPVSDPNVVYNFHFYEPFLFTHQGADWAGDVVYLRDIPYPSSPEAVQPAADQLEEGWLRDWVLYYGEERWDTGVIESLLATVGAWAGEHGVRVICNEFGAYTRYAWPEDRVRWTHDTRSGLEKYGIGWAMWEYDGDFGLVRRRGGETTVDGALAGALGLTLQAQR